MRKFTKAALLLALLAAGSVLASCGDAAVTPATATTEAVQTTATETETAGETEAVEVMPDLPEKDYGGITITFLDSGANDDTGVDWETYDIYAEEATGDTITDAVYARNIWMEETFNIKIAENKSSGKVLDDAKKSIQAGSYDFDFAMASIQGGLTLGQSGYVCDLNEVPYIDLSAEWWDQGCVRDCTIAGKTYFATGDVTTIDNDATWVLMFNKQLAENYDLNLYDLVDSNKWLIDTFYGYIKEGAKDLNGDGQMSGMDDQYGLATSGNTGYGLMYACGISFSGRDSDGYPTVETDVDRLATVTDIAAKIMSDKSITIITGDKGATDSNELRELFQDGRALFFGEVMQCVTRMRDSTTDFGLIPWPKLDESQENYYNFIHSTAGRGVCIPVTDPDLEMEGILLTAFCAKSMYTVTSAYYDVALTYKYMRDEESVRMLDIILDSRCFDLAYLYGWGKLVSTINSNISNGKTNIASTYEKKLSSAEKALQTTIDAYMENT